MTEKLYLTSIESGYYQSFNATVTEVDNEHITLDRTLFIPSEEVKIGTQVPYLARMAPSQ